MNANHRLVGTGCVMLASLFWVVGAMAASYTYESVNVPMTITDGGTIQSSIWVADSFKIKDVNVKLTITHPMNCDLDVYLWHRDEDAQREVEVELFTDVGGRVDDFIETILDDEAGQSVTTGVTPFTGTYRPEGRLSDFDLMNAKGEWELRITDDMVPDEGQLVSWSLTIEECVPPEAPTDPSPAHGEVNVSVDTTCLSWWGEPNAPDTVYDVYFGLAPDKMVLMASGLTGTEYCLVDALDVGTVYHWIVVARNACGTTPGVCVSGPWLFTTTGAPVVLCHDITVPADRNCQAIVTIDDLDCGSYDSGGGTITLILEPSGPYPIGVHTVTLTATNDKGGSTTATATITVLPTAYCYKKSAVCILESIEDSLTYDEPLLILAIHYLKMSLGADFDVEEDRVFWASGDRVAKRQGGFRGGRVFEFEQKASTLLKEYVESTGANFADEVDDVWDLLAEADRQLADVAITDAVFQGVPSQVVEAAKRLRNEGNVAKCAGGVNIPEVALKKYAEAWQTAVDGLGPATDYNRDGIVDADDLLMFSEDMLAELLP